MSSEWRQTRLSDLVDIKHGFAFKGEFFSDEPTLYQLTTPGNFAIGGGFQLGKGKFYKGPVPNDYVLCKDDLLVTMTDLSKAADTLGYAALVPEAHGTIWLHNQRVGLVTLKPNTNLNKMFLHYVMRTPDYRHWVVSTATGSTVKHTSPTRILDYQFLLPPKSTQHAIGEALSALDDRITVLRETNTTLEAIAQALFKSWFVDFDPVHAKMQGRVPEGMDEATAALFPDGFEESELGLMPRGWRVGQLGEVLELRNDRVQPSEITKNLPYVPIESIGAHTPFLPEHKSGEEANSSLILFKQGDILFGAMRPYFHKVCIAPFDGVTRTTVFTLKSINAKAQAFALFLAYSEDTVGYATQHSEGSTIPYAKWKNSFERMPIVLPSSALQEAFSRFVIPTLERANHNIQQAQTLATLRDTLLPRLISGQLRVDEN